MSKAMVYTNSHWNSVVGSLVYADENGVVLIQVQNPFEPEYVVGSVDYADDAMLLIDQTVCLYESRVFRLVDDVSDRAAKRLQGVVFSGYEQAAVHQDLSSDPREEF